MVAGEHAEAARIRRQALIEAELGGEVRDQEVGGPLLLLPPGHALGLRLEPLLHARELHRILGREGLREMLFRQLREKRGRVVPELAEPLSCTGWPITIVLTGERKLIACAARAAESVRSAVAGANVPLPACMARITTGLVVLIVS